jgi:nicotinate-nucleotide adenylyltransferase
MSPARRLGIMGGMFDPIHRGHVDLGRAAETALGLTRVLILPAAVPPHRTQPVASGFHRFAMVAMVVAGQPKWFASDLELLGAARSYTAATLERFRRDGYTSSELFFIVGADAFAEIEAWKDFPSILDEAHFAVVSRPGHPASALPDRLPVLSPRMTRAPLTMPAGPRPWIILIDAVTGDVSSTAIRQRCAIGEPIAGLVDARVEQHIARHGLYASAPAGERTEERRPDVTAGGLHG